MTNINVKIQENYNFSSKLLDIKLTDMYCKHMMKNDSNCQSKANRLLRASCKIGYEICEWGLYSNCPSDLSHHMGIITKMEKDNYNHPVRIVICKYDFCDKPIIWVDNLHSSVKYIREYGKDVKLKNIPFYVVDITNLDNPAIQGNRDNLRTSYADILGAISSAYKRYEWSNLKELIDVRYTIGDLLTDNPELYTYLNTRNNL